MWTLKGPLSSFSCVRGPPTVPGAAALHKTDRPPTALASPGCGAWVQELHQHLWTYRAMKAVGTWQASRRTGVEERWGGCWQKELGQRVREGWLEGAAGSERAGRGHEPGTWEGPHALPLASVSHL